MEPGTSTRHGHGMSNSITSIPSSSAHGRTESANASSLPSSSNTSHLSIVPPSTSSLSNPILRVQPHLHSTQAIPPPIPHRQPPLRTALVKRRSSYPPSNIDQLSSSQSTDQEGRPTLTENQQQLQIFAELGLPELASMWAPVGWDTLLNFEGDVNPAESYPAASSVASGSGSGRLQSEPLGDVKPAISSRVAGTASGSRAGKGVAGPASFEQGRATHQSSDLAWKTILASQVDVEGVGQIGVGRVLQEVWRRGGGEQVTSQGLWPSIIISLSLPEVESPGFRLPTPSPDSGLALQNLYNLTLRHWEPTIFTGLLSSFGSQAHGGMNFSAMLGAAQTQFIPSGGNAGEHIFGVATPQKELDMSQWTNLTPGGGADWSFLNNFEAGSGSPAKPNIAANIPGPSNLAYEVRDHRRDSSGRSTDEEGIQGLDEILAQMEEGVEAREAAARHEQMYAASSSAVPDLIPSHVAGRKRPAVDESPFQMPTPETDSSDTTILSGRGGQSIGNPNDRNNRQLSFNLVTPPSSNGSPHNPARVFNHRHPGGQSAIARPAPKHAFLPTPTPSSESLPQLTGGKKRNAMQLDMPIASFVPPPPMCMFFSPAFHDLQNGKVGVWKGDLTVRGKGGGKFSVLIVGESATGHMWQSNTWAPNIVYPPESQTSDDAGATATMIPVSHLAREGFTPAAMGMVLCNDANIEAYVQMVQGLHSEGVAFHLSTPGHLPIVFLPAKFDSNDPLQRLGVAFMTKPGLPAPRLAPRTASDTVAEAVAKSVRPVLTVPTPDGNAEEPKRKKRRQSAPAGSLPLPKSTTSARSKKRESGASTDGRPAAIPEEASEEKGS